MLRSFIVFAGLVLALGLAGCPQQADEPAGEAEVTEEEVVIEAPADDGSADAPAEDTSSFTGEPADDSGSDSDAGEDGDDAGEGEGS